MALLHPHKIARCSSTRPTPGLDDPPRGRARGCSPRTRPTPPTRTRPTLLGAARLRRRRAHRRRRSTPRRWRRRRRSSSPTRPTRSGRRTAGAGSPVAHRRRARRDRAPSSRGGGGLIVLGESEQDKYGNNLNELLAPLRHRDRDTTPSRTTSTTDGAPSWVLADLRSTARGAGADLLARVDERLLLPRRARSRSPTAPTRDRARPPRPPPRRARRSPSSPSTATGRVVVLADSDLFGDDCLGDLDHGDAVGQPRRTGPAGPAFAARRAAAPRAAARPGLGRRSRPRSTRCALLQDADGSVDLDGARRAPRRSTRSLTRSRRCARTSRTRPSTSTALERPPRLGDGGFAKPDFTALARAFRPDQHREDGIEHLVVFPMYKQNGRREKRLRGADRPRAVARVARRARARPLRQREVRAGHVRRPHARLRLRVRGPVPGDRLASARAPANHFGAIFCDREAERFRRVGAPPPTSLGAQPAAGRRRAAGAPELSREALTCCGTSSTTARTATATCRSTRS